MSAQEDLEALYLEAIDAGEEPACTVKCRRHLEQVARAYRTGIGVLLVKVDTGTHTVPSHAELAEARHLGWKRGRVNIGLANVYEVLTAEDAATSGWCWRCEGHRAFTTAAVLSTMRSDRKVLKA